MWRNLAKVQSTIQTIGNVVAPALSDEDGEESGDDDNDDPYDDDDGNGGLYGEVGDDRNSDAAHFANPYRSGQARQQRHPSQQPRMRAGPGDANDEDNDDDAFDPLHRHHRFPRPDRPEDQEEHHQNQARQHRGGFGLVGLIAKALDGPYPPSGDGDDDDEDDEDDDDNSHGSHGEALPSADPDDRAYSVAAYHDPHRFPRPVIEEEEEQIQFDSMSMPPDHYAHEELNQQQPRPLDASARDSALDAAGGASHAKTTVSDPPDEEDEDGRVTPPPPNRDEPSTSNMGLDAMSEHNPMRLVDPHQLPQPRMFGGNQREHGSVSPFGSPSTVRSTSRRSNGGIGAFAVTAAGLPPTREGDGDDDAEADTADDDASFGGGDGSGSIRLEQEEEVVEPSPTGRSNGSGGIDAASAILPPPLETSAAELPARTESSPPPLDSGSHPTFSSSTHVPVAADPLLAVPPTLDAPESRTHSEEPALSTTAAPPQPPPLVEYSTRPVISSSPGMDEKSTTNGSSPSPDELQQQQQQQQQEQQQEQQLQQRERKLERRCRELEDKLRQAEARIQVLEDAAALSQVTTANSERDAMERLRVEFQEKEARIMAAATEDHEQELRFLTNDMEIKVQSLRQEMEQERDVFEREREYFERLVAEANARAEQAERQYQRERAKQETTMNQSQKSHDRELHMQAEKLAETMALLDEREDQVSKLKALVQSLQSKLSEHAEGAELAEDEVEELQHENEELRQAVQRLDTTCKELQKKNTELHADSNKLSELKLELRLLKEERDRERAKSQTESAEAHGSRAQVEDERDTAIAQVQDLQQQLAAVLADLAMAKSDVERTLMARNNLQLALESFQGEREAELAMLEEQRHETERSIKAAHAVAIDAMREANEAHLREIQMAADASVRHSMEEIKLLETKLAAFKSENVHMRRSLDEAIYRLQATQEDVIDRTLMKNILMDWLTKTGTKERKDVLELMASVLHFTEEEKERVHIGPHAGALEKVVHTVAAPLPPSKADVEHLAGDTVREKWVNFLLAETED